MELLGIEMSFEEFDKLMCEQSQGKELIVEDGKVITKDQSTNPDILREIQEQKRQRDEELLLSQINKEIDELQYDLIQAYCGAQFGIEIIDGVEVDRLAEKKKRFQLLHNQQRKLLDKPAREYIKE